MDAVIKIGGSLAQSQSLPRLMETISQLAQRHRLVVLPGGGPFADLVRDQCRLRALTDVAAHWMAISAMDQFGYLLADLCENTQTVRDFSSAAQTAKAGRLPVFLPYGPMLAADPLPNSWDVTSDSIAAWVAGAMQAKRLVLLKSVDLAPAAASFGVHERDALGDKATLADLAAWEGVDSYFTEALAPLEMDVWIVNGRHPERLRQLLENGQTIGTRLDKAHP